MNDKDSFATGLRCEERYDARIRYVEAEKKGRVQPVVKGKEA